MTFGVAILKTGLLDRLRLKGWRNALLRTVGMRAIPKGKGTFTSDTDLSEDPQITILRRPGVEVWTGFTIAYMLEVMQETYPLPQNRRAFHCAK